MQNRLFINFCFVFVAIIIFSACSSQNNKSATEESFSSEILELASIVGVDPAELQKEIDTLSDENEPSYLLDSPINYNVLACIADSDRNGRINLTDSVNLSKQLGRTCSSIALNASWDPDIEDNLPCMNLAYESNLAPDEQIINLSDVAIYSVIINNYNSFSTDYCLDGLGGDSDYLPPYIEAYAWIALNPLSDDSDSDGITDLFEFIGKKPPKASFPHKNVSAGTEHSCAIIEGGVIKCWGSNNYGQLGNGTYIDSPSPIQVEGISKAVSVAAGPQHTCALMLDKTVKCWGENFAGQLGNGTHRDSPSPTYVAGINNANSIAVDGMHTCATLADNSIKCWGYDGCGELGTGVQGVESSLPVSVLGIDNAVYSVAGRYHSGALMNDKSVMWWGVIGSNPMSTIPVPLSNIGPVSFLGSGHETSYILLEDGTAMYWGKDSLYRYCEFQDAYQNFPVAIDDFANAETISGGSCHSCALFSDGKIKCAGVFFSNTPQYVDGIDNAVSLASGDKHSCAILADHTIKCWGSNGKGQLGDGSIGSFVSVPVSVTSINNARTN